MPIDDDDEEDDDDNDQLTMMLRNKGCPEETKARSRGSLAPYTDSDWVPPGSQIEFPSQQHNQNYGK